MMNHHRYYGRLDQPVQSCIVGTGDFGRTFLRQAQRCAMLGARVAVDVSAERAGAALLAAGRAARDIAACATAAEARRAWDAGRAVAAARLEAVLDLPIQVVVEATGSPEAGARHALLAIEAGKHVALATKEADVVVGPVLAARAAAAGCVVTPVDGDQPALLMGLVSWAELLGFTVVTAGKSSEYDFVYDERAGTLSCNGRSAAVPGLAALWSDAGRAIPGLVDARSRAAAAFPQRTVPDLCEMLVVANATGLAPDRPDLHAPLLRIPEVATAFTTAAEGGLVRGDRRVDVFNCLRRPDEVSFAGGVFVVVRCDDAASWSVLREKGHLVGRDGKAAMLWLPRHLLGLEAATSVLDAGVHGASSGSDRPRPLFDLGLRAEADLKAGTVLAASGHHHSIAGASGHALPGRALGPGVPIPYYLAADRRLLRDVPAGELVRYDDVEIAEGSSLARARRMQDALFFGEGAVGER